MTDFELQRCTRRCAQTDREFRPGERIVSVLLPDGAIVKRLDYCLDAWREPPESAIAWWKSQMPGGSGRTSWAPSDVMLDYFQRLEGEPGKEDVRFVLALLMVRRRILRLEHTEQNSSGEEVLILYCPRQETEYRVRSVMPSGSRADEIQAELSQLLVTTTG